MNASVAQAAIDAPPATPARVLVMHATPLVAQGVAAVLAARTAFVVHQADGPPFGIDTALAAADIVVTDHEGGLRCIAGLRDRPPGHRGAPRILVVTPSRRERDLRVALECGVHGYLLSDCSQQELLDAVSFLHHGARWLSPELAQRMAESLTGNALTAREAEVLAVMVRGLSNKAIAAALGVSVGTVKAHVKAVLGKLGARSRTEAVAIANRRGLIGGPGAP